MRTAILFTALAIIYSAFHVHSQTIQSIEMPANKIMAKIPATPAGVTTYAAIGHETLRDQTINSNAQYVKIVINLLATLATGKNDKSLCAAYENFFAAPTTDSYLFSSACTMLNLWSIDAHFGQIPTAK